MIIDSSRALWPGRRRRASVFGSDNVSGRMGMGAIVQEKGRGCR